MTNGIEVQVQSILAAITQKYVMTDLEIPPEVLVLKDEVMDIFVKAKNENDPEVIARYEHRLGEIRESVIAGD